MGGFFFEFEAIRTDSTEMLHAGASRTTMRDCMDGGLDPNGRRRAEVARAILDDRRTFVCGRRSRSAAVVSSPRASCSRALPSRTPRTRWCGYSGASSRTERRARMRRAPASPPAPAPSDPAQPNPRQIFLRIEKSRVAALSALIESARCGSPRHASRWLARGEPVRSLRSTPSARPDGEESLLLAPPTLATAAPSRNPWHSVSSLSGP